MSPKTTTPPLASTSISGNIIVVIGPNGYGKTTYLEKQEETLRNSGKSTLFIPSEIKLLDEIKDTVDTSKTMEFFVAEILETPDFVAKRDDLFTEVTEIISENRDFMNEIIDEVLNLNSTARAKDFISSNPRIMIKNPIKINQDDVKGKMGSGQRMQLVLKLATKSSKDYIFLDEPEKYSHPSLLNYTAKAINDLARKGKVVYIATHSPKLVSMLEVDYSDIKIINDSSHKPKEIPFDEAALQASKLFALGSMNDKFKRYYNDGDSLKNCIARRHGRHFIEALFAKKVFLCEGANDEIFVNVALQDVGGYYDDYCVLKAWGKTNLPVFMKLLIELGIDVTVLFDVDDESKFNHKEANNAIRSMGSYCTMIEFSQNLEDEVSYTEKKGDTLAFLDHLESQDFKKYKSQLT